MANPAAPIAESIDADATPITCGESPSSHLEQTGAIPQSLNNLAAVEAAASVADENIPPVATTSDAAVASDPTESAAPAEFAAPADVAAPSARATKKAFRSKDGKAALTKGKPGVKAVGDKKNILRRSVDAVTEAASALKAKVAKKPAAEKKAPAAEKEVPKTKAATPKAAASPKKAAAASPKAAAVKPKAEEAKEKATKKAGEVKKGLVSKLGKKKPADKAAADKPAAAADPPAVQVEAAAA